MSRIAEYASTLTPAERERFGDLIREHAEQEARIAANAARATDALERCALSEREYAEGVRELRRLSLRLRDTIGRLYLVLVPAQGRVS